ncbi:AAA family ATPase [Pseudolabrys taiwanensis]|uniref:AAA family ATPase n=1 Tax=Pseudolabrys taiwanensis TaxID=331696 RepID=A0A345ZZD0_9HYPH|nr:AAA family ATPase [Pseudolabrys taiwanensis]AXK82277.1 AAA family ATPase [Pseudolabrys taiwanensis]
MTILTPDIEHSCFPPRSLADIVGQKQVVERLRSRFRRNQHDTALLLYGPDGVGKRTVANLYARALLCDQPRADSAVPCGVCSACRTPVGNNFDCLEIEAGISSAKERVRELKEKLSEWLRTVPIGPRHILIVDGFERASPELVDALLKPLEKEENERAPATPTTVIFLTETLEGVRQAGQSRCEVERLRPLPDIEARCLIARMLSARGNVRLDDDAFDSFVVGSRGLPGLIAHALDSLSNDANVDARHIRQIFDIDWADSAGSYWLKLFERSPNEEQRDSFSTDFPIATLVSRLRGVWARLYASMVNSRPIRFDEPALHFLDEALLQRLCQHLKERAFRKKQGVMALWSDIAGVLLQENFADEGGRCLLEREVAALIRVD